MQSFSSKLLLAATASLPFFVAVNADGAAKPWDYKKNSKDWSESFETCATGLKQSPIDLIDSDVFVTKKLQIKGYDYKDYESWTVPSTAATSLSADETGRLEVSFDDGRNGLFRPVQFHFHSPSEHTKNGKGFPLELHIVHLDTVTSKPAAVIGILFEINADPKFDNFYFDKIQPEQASDAKRNEDEYVGPLHLGTFLQQIDFREVYNYDGSLTTPPCTEGINWLVVKKPVEISQSQFDIINAHWQGNSTFAGGFGNNRLPQPLSGRQVRLSELNKAALENQSKQVPVIQSNADEKSKDTLTFCSDCKTADHKDENHSAAKEDHDNHSAAKEEDDNHGASKPWNYKKEGKDWPIDFPLCETGMNQSPIDLKDDGLIITDKLQLKGQGYQDRENFEINDVTKATSFPAEEKGRLDVRFNENKTGLFKPLQFHLHAPSEHTVNGELYPLEIHIVHVDAATGVPAAVIGIFFEESEDPDFENEFLNDLLPELTNGPSKTGKTVGTLNLGTFLKQVDFREVYNYDGSFTTPPCTEGINWLVVKKPLKISKEQLEVFVDHWAGNLAFAGGFGNNRLPQPLKGRTVKLSKFDAKFDENQSKGLLTLCSNCQTAAAVNPATGNTNSTNPATSQVNAVPTSINYQPAGPLHFTNYTSISQVAQPAVNNYTVETSNNTNINYSGAGPVTTNTTTINSSLIGAGETKVTPHEVKAEPKKTTNTRHKGAHRGATVEVNNNVSNYIGGSVGNIQTPVISNNISNNVNVSAQGSDEDFEDEEEYEEEEEEEEEDDVLPAWFLKWVNQQRSNGKI